MAITLSIVSNAKQDLSLFCIRACCPCLKLLAYQSTIIATWDEPTLMTTWKHVEQVCRYVYFKEDEYMKGRASSVGLDVTETGGITLAIAMRQTITSIKKGEDRPLRIVFTKTGCATQECTFSLHGTAWGSPVQSSAFPTVELLQYHLLAGPVSQSTQGTTSTTWLCPRP